MADPSKAHEAVRAAIRDASAGLVERGPLVELVALAAVAGEHLLVIGPPGTAKSEAVRRIASALGGTCFEYLVGRFTEPSEIFGPVDLRKLKEGIVETETRGMLPEADIAFLDEVFSGSTAILNTLLGVLNERVFRRGHSIVRCPLRVCVGAANQLPTDEALAAFADRFLLRVFVEPIVDARLEELLEGGARLAASRGHERAADLGAIDALGAAAAKADLSGVRGDIAHAVRVLRKAGIALSDRRIVKAQRLVAAAAALDGRSAPSAADLWPLVCVVPTRAAQETARDALRDVLARSESGALVEAALEASLGERARARAIETSAEAIVSAPIPAEPAAREAHRLRLESVGRTIDAGFAKETLPESLAAVRARIVARLAEAAK